MPAYILSKRCEARNGVGHTAVGRLAIEAQNRIRSRRGTRADSLVVFGKVVGCHRKAILRELLQLSDRLPARSLVGTIRLQDRKGGFEPCNRIPALSRTQIALRDISGILLAKCSRVIDVHVP